MTLGQILLNLSNHWSLKCWPFKMVTYSNMGCTSKDNMVIDQSQHLAKHKTHCFSISSKLVKWVQYETEHFVRSWSLNLRWQHILLLQMSLLGIFGLLTNKLGLGMIGEREGESWLVRSNSKNRFWNSVLLLRLCQLLESIGLHFTKTKAIKKLNYKLTNIYSF